MGRNHCLSTQDIRSFPKVDVQSLLYIPSPDQAAGEYERLSLHHEAASARQMLKTLAQALERIRQGRFGECAECGGDIEPKRLEAIPWARYCVKCQEAREQQD
jgi:RNA polymerase-binding transcription factor DksA